MTNVSIQAKLLSHAKSLEQYKAYQAALEWDLTDPIVIDSRDDVKSTTRWQKRLDPYQHQVTNLITFCKRLPVSLLADDVGLGKTISAGLIMSELIARVRLSKTLIVAPKLLGPQWKEELESKFDIPVTVVSGRELIDADPDELGAVVTTYHSARDHIRKLPKDRFQMLILDEAHKLRNLYGVEKAPQVTMQMRGVLEERRFPYVLMLTATPIQNRLWDLYSLVDLLTVARGHNNPFGSEGVFARKFILGDREKARQLKPESATEFRTIVYGYMSRVRRGDVQLHFPSRKVQLHRVDPTAQEMDLIAVVGRGIQKLNRLAQISILQALTSSPQALSSQLDNMERNLTIAPDFAAAVRSVVKTMKTSAKLIGLGALIQRLKHEQPDGWRLVIFTGRRETQTTIQIFLEGYGLDVGIINGSSGSRNQETLHRFRSEPPKLRVIISTEAGSEGVNMQAANVLVNYDLPWNPMIVEQRIGRIQRLASRYASVAIFNVTLRGTFEEYIVGRLMEKLQMTATAVGDIESLLEGAGIGGEEEDGGFEERIRQLVVAALEGVDVSESVRKAEASIEQAKRTLEEEARNIDELVGGSGALGYVGPRAPLLVPVSRSMSEKEFTFAELAARGATITELRNGDFEVKGGGHDGCIRFDDPGEFCRGELYKQGFSAFSRLVQETVATGRYRINDLDLDPIKGSQKICSQWVDDFGGVYRHSSCLGARRTFDGILLLRARITVAHDAYERLIEVPVNNEDDTNVPFQSDGLKSLSPLVEDIVKSLHVPPERVAEAVEQDRNVAEFSRFYLERREHEIKSVGSDERKRVKIEEDFTPRLMITVAGAEGSVARSVRTTVAFEVEGYTYNNEIVVVPALGIVTEAPSLAACAISARTVPSSCLGRCSVTGQLALLHLLVRSEVSGRLAMPSQMTTCEVSGKHVILDETAVSSVTGRRVLASGLRRSALSAKVAEPEHFGTCEFTGQAILLTELRTSNISRKQYREDEAGVSALSGRVGHKSEFVDCHETSISIASDEAEQCEATGALVRPGVLITCGETGAHVLPSETRT
jgi:superfamily II DNA or RNA helicase